MDRNNTFLILPWSPEHQGGVTGVVTQIIENWSELYGQNPSLVVNDWDFRKPHKLSNVYYFRFSLLGKISPIGLFKSFLLFPLTLFHTHFFLVQNNVAVVNFHYPGLSPLGIALLKRFRLFNGRLILSYHGTDVYSPRYWLENFLYRFLFSSADAIVACSESLAKRMAKTFNLNLEEISVIYNGVNIDVFKPIPDICVNIQTQLPDNFIVGIGAFIPRKSQKTLLDAFYMLVDQFPNLHLCFAGADGPDRDYLVDQVRQFDLEKRVHFFINIKPNEVAFILSKAKICVQTALAESFPLAVLEAGAVGVSIAVTSIEGHSELIVERETGRFFSVSDSVNCASVIAEIFADPDQAKRMANNFRHRILNELTWETCIKKYRDIYYPNPL